jgi:hypothetical protein
MNMYAQTDGISYQAVIINPSGEELPGVDSNGNILPNAKITIRFTILDETNSEEYQEVQTTQTDLYGRINLIIGNQNRENFALIQWDGTPKDLKVEIDFKGSGGNFVDMSREQLTFVPYSYHRNILARGTLIVDDTTDLNGELIVQGPTNLNSTLNVNDNNDTNLSGQLNVQGKTNLKSNFEVDGQTTLNDSLNVNAKSNFSGNMQVTADAVFEGKMDFKSEEPANFNSMVIKDSIDVDGPANFHRQVRISGNFKLAAKSNLKKIPASKGGALSSYALLIDSTDQGIAIVVDGERDKDNKFISFWDTSTNPDSPSDPAVLWGRIEGQSVSNLENSSGYENELRSLKWGIALAFYDNYKAYYEIVLAGIGLTAAITSSTACAGVGACITLPAPSLIAEAILVLVFKLADGVVTVVNTVKAFKEKSDFEDYKINGIGVTYSSGAGDYAEWLPKENTTDSFNEGEVVGINNGQVSKNTWNADKIMIVSTRPIVLGNMPQLNQEMNSVKIAFMGQVPVHVMGNVEPGDYILPMELGGGLAKAVDPSKMKIEDYKKVAGVAWNVIEKIADKISVVNVAVGINTNDLATVMSQQDEELANLHDQYAQLKSQMEYYNAVLARLVPGYAEEIDLQIDSIPSKSTKNKNDPNKVTVENEILHTTEDDIIYFEISKEQVEAGLDMARQQYLEMLEDSNNLNKFAIDKNTIKEVGIDQLSLMPIEEHPFWQKMDTDPSYKAEIIGYIQSNMEKSMHTHKKYANKFTDLKVKK